MPASIPLLLPRRDWRNSGPYHRDMNGPVIVEEVVEPSVEVLEALGRLLPQLTASARIPDAQMFERLTKSHGTHLFVARDESGRIVGTLTLVVFDTPLARRARIEDVVVDTEARGLGIGEALTKRGLALAA